MSAARRSQRYSGALAGAFLRDANCVDSTLEQLVTVFFAQTRPVLRVAGFSELAALTAVIQTEAFCHAERESAPNLNKNEMNNLREYLIHHNDQDASWWPFSSLKPAQHQILSWKRCFGLACIYLIPALLLLILADTLLGGATGWYSALMLLVVSVMPATLAFRILIGRSWNARAAALQASMARRERFLATASSREEQAD